MKTRNLWKSFPKMGRLIYSQRGFAVPRPTREQTTERFERWRQLLHYLKEQMQEAPEEAHRETLLRFLSRHEDKLIASPLSVQRWLAGEQFVNRTTRHKVALALAVEPLALENFLMWGEPTWEEFVKLIPPLPSDYRRSSRWELSVDTRDRLAVLNLMKGLANYLSLQELVLIRDDIVSRIDREVERLQLNPERPRKYKSVTQLIQDCQVRMGLSNEQFIETVLESSGEFNEDSLREVLRGDRLPTQEELKILLRYMKDETGNSYRFEDLPLLQDNGFDSTNNEEERSL